MKCKEIRKYLNDYLDGLLPDDKEKLISDHLISCSGCAEELEKTAALTRRAKMLSPEISPERDLWEGISKRISKEENHVFRIDLIQSRSSHASGLFSGRKLIAVGSAAAAVLIVSLLLFFLNNEQTPFWQVEQIAGHPFVGNQKIYEPGKLEVGDWIITDDSSKARLKVGVIGEVDVYPHSRLKLLKANSSEQRISLEKGRIEAAIWAPPKLFFVETPSATAIDLGCIYELNVSEDGSGFLQVTSGWVAFEHDGKESLVPMGAVCETRVKHGPGTPYYQTATAEFKTALEQLDFENGGEEMLDVVLIESAKNDALSLWHLLKRSDTESKLKIFNKLNGMFDISADITLEGILNNNKEMYEDLWEEVQLGSKSIWKF